MPYAGMVLECNRMPQLSVPAPAGEINRHEVVFIFWPLVSRAALPCVIRGARFTFCKSNKETF
jgi:hypothetical protein